MTFRVSSSSEFHGDRGLDAAQRAAGEVARAVNRSGAGTVRRATVLDSAGNPTTQITFTAGQTVMMVHGLPLTRGLSPSAVPSGWRCVDVVTGYGSFKRSAWDDATLSITSENACTAVFEVFV